MKLSALAAQIKNCGHCEVINNGGRVFVGTTSAFYCMDGYPQNTGRGRTGRYVGHSAEEDEKHLLSRGIHH